MTQKLAVSKTLLFFPSIHKRNPILEYSLCSPWFQTPNKVVLVANSRFILINLVYLICSTAVRFLNRSQFMSSVWILRSCWLSSSSWPLGLFHYLISIITRYFSLSPGRWIRLQHFIFKLQPGTQNGLISYHSYAGIRIDYRQCKMQDILIISKWKLKFLNFKKLFAVCLNLFRIFRWYWLLEWMTQWWELNVRNTFASFVSKTFSWKCENAVYRSEHDRYFGASSKRAAIINCASQSHFNGALNVQFVICLEPQAFQLQWKRCTNSMQCAKRNATNTNDCKNFQFLFSQMFCVHHRMFGFRFSYKSSWLAAFYASGALIIFYRNCHSSISHRFKEVELLPISNSNVRRSLMFVFT